MSLRGDVCVVTGACGFLGKSLVKLLLEEEKMAEIRLLDKHVQPEFLKSLEGKTCLSLHYSSSYFAEAHLKCRKMFVSFFYNSPLFLIDMIKSCSSYFMRTQLLLEACIQENVASFIYTSSIEVMGPNSRGEPIFYGSEDTVYDCTLKFSYSKTKKEAEQRTLQANSEVLQNGGQLATCALRPMYIYGEDSHFLLGHMRDGIRNKNVLYRISRAEARVNPVYVGNVAVAHLQAARCLKDPQKRNVIGGKLYFISDDTPPISYSDLNHVLMSPLGFSIQEKLPLPFCLLYVACFFLDILCTMLRPFIRIALCPRVFSFQYKKNTPHILQPLLKLKVVLLLPLSISYFISFVSYM
uniref:3-beta hydroxysteroid dehydrogenase/isomerase domain-containing protein n=1 Tax=Monopterus albus TaxID=43700 RepID=A0A3Q3K2P8_MONAL